MDTYKTISAPSASRYTVKMSKFMAFAIPVTTVEQAQAEIKRIQNEYHDARHVCWAYMLGHERNVWQLNDNGEPSGTAGKPILGQLNSFGLTDVAVAVVRYFGGIKLGTGGLIDAYRTAARMALEEAEIVERHATAIIHVTCPYLNLNAVMGAIKNRNLSILRQQFDNVCDFQLEVRLDHLEQTIKTLSENARVEREGK